MTYQLQLQHFTFNGVSISIYVPDAESVQEYYLQQKAVDNAAIFPYWSKVWPAAHAISIFITSHPDYILNKKVIELACGLALPSLIAAKYAATVSCSDYAADALATVKRSIIHNGFNNVAASLLNWEQLSSGITADVILLSDINYEPERFDALYGKIVMFLNNKSTIILSTPQRLMAKPFIERIMPFVIQQEEIELRENNSNTIVAATVFVLSIHK